MDDRHSAMLWQMMQSLGANTQEDHSTPAEPPTFEHTLLSLRPLMSPKQQRIIDLMIKIQEVKELLNEIHSS